jgi:hypothetical protein
LFLLVQPAIEDKKVTAQDTIVKDALTQGTHREFNVKKFMIQAISLSSLRSLRSTGFDLSSCEKNLAQIAAEVKIIVTARYSG